MQVVLASGSPRRRALLAGLGMTFDVIKTDIDETQYPNELPTVYVARMSAEKAAAAIARLGDLPAIVIAADTIVIAADTIGITDNGDILGKPIDADDARSMLQRMRGASHRVCTSLTVARHDRQMPSEPVTELTFTTVHMRAYSDADIAAYIATGDPFDKAGAYAIQHDGFHPVERIEGDYENVVGLPTATLRALLARIGVSLPPVTGT